MSPSVVITGASTGIGRACALRMDRLGHTVFAGVRRPEDGDSLVTEGSNRLRPLVLDVTDADTITAATQAVERAVEGRGLQGLVNNAGIGIGGPVEALDLDRLRHQFEVNLFGQVAVTQAFLPLLRSGSGRVVNMSSVSGRVAQPFMGPYCASKFALEAITDSLRREVREQGIAVSAVQPGVIQTPIWDKAQAAADEVHRELAGELAQLYGRAATGAKKTFAKLAAGGTSPERVADAVEHALTAKRPRLRYQVGTDAKIGVTLARLLPDRGFDWFLGRFASKV